MKSRSASCLLAAACVAAASAAHALPLSERASVELFAGGNAGMPGSFRGSFNSEGAGGTTSYDRLAFDDLYHHDYTAGAEFDYALDSHLSTFLRAAISQYGGTSREIGTFFSDSQGRVPVFARFGDADSREVDWGARYTFLSGDKWRPFLGAALGATRVSDTFAVAGAPGDDPSTRVELGRQSTVFQQRVETGLQYSPMRNFDLRLTAAANHVGAGRGSDDPNLTLLGLDQAQSRLRAHWDYPAELGAVWHF
jgi:hypothetical protein